MKPVSTCILNAWDYKEDLKQVLAYSYCSFGGNISL